ncbi:MAG: aryl-sulfate sulfotransferase [Eubacterium sp.]|nr:aryl-sulfate sulfotransferase [Eubacterium sp.]
MAGGISSVMVRQTQRIKRKWKKKKARSAGKRIHVYTDPDGGVIRICGVGWLAKKASVLEPMFCRKEAAGILSNIDTESMYALKSATRDVCLEQMLQSETYTFDNIFVIRNPYGEAPLTALAIFYTEKEYAVRVTVKGTTKATDYVQEIPKAKYHRVPILGLYAGRENTVRLELIGEDGKTVAKHTFPITTKKLPKELQNIITVKKMSEDPGIPFVMISGGLGIKTCVFDKEGEIRYFLRRMVKGYGIFPLENGHFFYMEKEISTPSYSNPQCVMSYDMDYLGRVYQCYLTKDGVHHTVEEKAGGNILAGSNTMMEHTEDMVIEIDRHTGEVVWELRVEDLFDGTYKDMMDWAHVNSAVYCEKDHSVLLSLRNIHTVCSVDYETKQLRWMLSDTEFWKGTKMTDKMLAPVGKVPWVYQQHAAYELDADFDGNPDTKHIMIFDNHWAVRRKADSFDDDPLSYVSIYTVNEKEMTVSLYKRFGFRKTRIRANSIYLPEEGRMYSMAGSFAKSLKGNKGAVYEFDFETGKTLSEIRIKPGFFRGYAFEPDVTALTKPLPLNREYVCGNLRQPKPVKLQDMEKISFKRCKKLTDPAYFLLRQEDLIFIREVDHAISKIYFAGAKGVFEVNYEDTYQTMKTFEDKEYFITTQINHLPKDRYKIYVEVKGELYNTGKWVSTCNG